MRSYSFYLFFIVLLFPLNAAATTAESLKRQYGIEISFDHNTAQQAVNTYQTRMTPSQSHHGPLMLTMLETFLKCYRGNVLKNNLNKIFLVGKIYVGDTEISATYSPHHKVIVLAAWQELVYFAHHEFSSILIQSGFPYKELWMEYNGAPYKHWTNYRPMKKSVRTRKLGFYYHYSQVSFEEDFNVLAGMALSSPAATEEAVRPYSRIRGKLAIVKRFYRNIFICTF